MLMTPDQIIKARDLYEQEKKELEERAEQRKQRYWTPERRKELEAIVEEKLKLASTGVAVPFTKEEAFFAGAYEDDVEKICYLELENDIA